MNPEGTEAGSYLKSAPRARNFLQVFEPNTILAALIELLTNSTARRLVLIPLVHSQPVVGTLKFQIPDNPTDKTRRE